MKETTAKLGTDPRFLQQVHTYITVVTKSIGGKALTLKAFAGLSDDIEVEEHLTSVPPLEKGDRVLVVVSENGLVITGKLRSKDEQPLSAIEEKDGELLFKADSKINLQVGEAQLELRANGQVIIDGQHIYSLSQGSNIIKGKVIKLN